MKKPKISNLLNNKRVVLVSELVPFKQINQGKFIDSFDVVARINHSFIFPPEAKKYIGSRTDISYSPLLDIREIKSEIAKGRNIEDICANLLLMCCIGGDLVFKVINSEYSLMNGTTPLRKVLKSKFPDASSSEDLIAISDILSYNVKELHVVGLNPRTKKNRIFLRKLCEENNNVYFDNYVYRSIFHHTVSSHVSRKVILKNSQSPGDILMMTAAVRDLKMSYPSISVDVRTTCKELWDNNPHITPLEETEDGVEVYKVGYPIINNSNDGAYHFIHGFRKDIEEKMNIDIKQTKFCGDIHFSEEELSWISMINQHYTHEDTPFWLICTGGKTDYTAKWWIPEYAQEVVDYFKDKIQFVQFGYNGKGHYHPPLNNVINLVGKTDLRMFMRLVYHCDGVITPVSFAMHLAAAMPRKPGKPMNKPCVVTAGGREPCTFTRYTHHGYIHANGYLKCCENGGCWKSRTVPLGDGDKKDNELCTNTVDFNGRKVQRCMLDFVTPYAVIQEVEKYYKGGMLKYLDEVDQNHHNIVKKINNIKTEVRNIMNETTKASYRRVRDTRFEKTFFVGKGLDIGSGNDPLSKDIFTNITELDTFDLIQGNAQNILKYKQENYYDFVYSSHCLEHMSDPYSAVQDWFKLVKNKGHMILVVPDEDLYEQKEFPSKFNKDHKFTFTIYKKNSWSKKSINVIEMISQLENCQIIKIDLLDHDYDYSKKNIDQTLEKSESAIEIILKKKYDIK
jgi:SAM-dependent methyltransferase